MQYLCIKQITAGEVAYHPGEIIPDGVILPERSGKLIKSGYISALEETAPGAYDGMVQIAVKGASDEQFTAIFAKPEDIQQVFSIMQLNAEEGARAIADVKSEDVLTLLHAADSRKTIKDAAKKQADNLFPAEDVPDESTGDNTDMGMDTEGADT